ncbi:XRE family transcriptional regulator [Acetobacterium bakii]|uniref:XRE family transcriptional regulator n=1 Tax=Acetobacterium bakii TaxID=52689 RepID=UPI000681844E|nr:XRE family transcriptional regulator [Acetobacterium bakii]
MINEKIRTLKKQSHLTAYEISEKSRVPLPTVHKILSGETKNPKYETLRAIVEALDCIIQIEPAQNGNMHDFSEKESGIVGLYRQLSSDGKAFFQKNIKNFLDYEIHFKIKENHQRIKELPLYLLPASAGIGSFLDSHHYEFTPFSAELIPSGTKFAIRVAGDSMEPAYYDNDIVFIQPASLLEEGDVGIIVINDEGYIKQYRDHQFISFNPKYKPILPGEYDNVRIAGKVLSKYEKRKGE